MSAAANADVYRGSRYWRGYPARYRRKIPGVLASAGCAFLLLVLLPILGAAAWLASQAGLLSKILFGGMLSAIAAWCSFAYFRPRSIFQVQVLPYFETKVGDTETFLAGESLARNWERLDALADELGVGPLSDFGFADDFDGEVVTWHDSSKGYEVVNAIRQRVETGSLDDARGLVQDLDVLANALSNAARRGIRFSLLIRVGDSVSPMEMGQRIGSFF